MFRKHLAASLAALLAVAACAPRAAAQSGRRPPRAGGDKGFVSPTGGKSGAAEGHGAETRKEFDPRGLNEGRTGAVVYAEDEDEHPNKADKVVGVILLGYIILWAVVTARSDGYAPSGGFAGGAGLRR